jgi:hypothetical protein
MQRKKVAQKSSQKPLEVGTGVRTEIYAVAIWFAEIYGPRLAFNLRSDISLSFNWTTEFAILDYENER